MTWCVPLPCSHASAADRQCYTVVTDVWPDSPLCDAFAEVDAVVPFVRCAMACLWRRGADSCGNRRPHAPYEPVWMDWINKHLPDPETLPPRPFTRANLEDPYAEPEVIWVNHRGEVVPRPEGIKITTLGAHGEASRESATEGNHQGDEERDTVRTVGDRDLRTPPAGCSDGGEQGKEQHGAGDSADTTTSGDTSFSSSVPSQSSELPPKSPKSPASTSSGPRCFDSPGGGMSPLRRFLNSPPSSGR